MTTRTLLLMPGDGIGPEAMAEVEKLIALMNETVGAGFTIERGLVGGAALDAHGTPVSEGDMALALAADAVLFGAGLVAFFLSLSSRDDCKNLKQIPKTSL